MLKRELDITRMHEPIGPRVSSALKPPTPLFQNLTMKCYFVDSFSLVLRLRPQFLVVFGAVGPKSDSSFCLDESIFFTDRSTKRSSQKGTDNSDFYCFTGHPTCYLRRSKVQRHES